MDGLQRERPWGLGGNPHGPGQAAVGHWTSSPDTHDGCNAADDADIPAALVFGTSDRQQLARDAAIQDRRQRRRRRPPAQEEDEEEEAPAQAEAPAQEDVDPEVLIYL